METQAQRPPLEGIRVLDIGTFVAGPVTATYLADFGAEVIKVERPGQGDSLRHAGPGPEEGMSYWWLVDGRNKKSVTLNLAHPEGRDLFLRLVALSDVVVENLRPGTLERLGLGWEVLRGVNPRLILARVSGFGQEGPLAGRAGYEPVAEAFGGVTYITGFPDRPPVRPGPPLADYGSALMTAFAVLLALYARDTRPDGQGQVVDIALYDFPFRAVAHSLATYARTGRVRERTGNAGFIGAPSDHFQTADGGWISLAVIGDVEWERFCRAVGRPEWLEDPRYATQADRDARQAEIHAFTAEWVRRHTRDEAVRILGEAGLAVGPIYSVADIARDPHYRARGSIEEVEVPGVGPLPMPAVVPRLQGTPGAIRQPPPRLGEHTEEVLCGLLGLSPQEVERLRREGVV